MQPDPFAVLRVEVQTIVNRLRVTDEPVERRILLSELRQIFERLAAESDHRRAWARH